MLWAKIHIWVLQAGQIYWARIRSLVGQAW
jgi:hypothetical protein